MPKEETKPPTTADFLKDLAEGAVKAVATGDVGAVRAPIAAVLNRAGDALEAKAAKAATIEAKGEPHATRQQSRTTKPKRRTD